MKIATYRHGSRESFGVVVDGGFVDVPRAWPGGPGSVLEALQAGPKVMAAIQEIGQRSECVISKEKAVLLSPIRQPLKVIGLAGNYPEHIRETTRLEVSAERLRATTVPRPFLMPGTCIMGHEAVVAWPAYSDEIDYEIELAVIIRTWAKHVSPADALKYVAGFSIANDISARSVTFTDGRAHRPGDEFFDWLCGKWADGFCPIGPHLVTTDEIADVQNLDMVLTVNGEIRQQANTHDMIFGVREIISFLSHVMTLVPGDVILTGTPAGTGAADGRFLAPGDRVLSRIDGLGELAFAMDRTFPEAAATRNRALTVRTPWRRGTTDEERR